jgi:hypothetical protein
LLQAESDRDNDNEKKAPQSLDGNAILMFLHIFVCLFSSLLLAGTMAVLFAVMQLHYVQGRSRDFSFHADSYPEEKIIFVTFFNRDQTANKTEFGAFSSTQVLEEHCIWWGLGFGSLTCNVSFCYYTICGRLLLLFR